MKPKEPESKAKKFRFNRSGRPVTNVAVDSRLENKTLQEVAFLWKVALARKDNANLKIIRHCLVNKFNREVPK